jgi:hypothetical protein
VSAALAVVAILVTAVLVGGTVLALFAPRGPDDDE